MGVFEALWVNCKVYFQASGGPATSEWEEPDEDCPLRDANNKRVPRLTVKVCTEL